MKPNLNFHNEYFASIPKENREKALTLLRKISAEKPEMYRDLKIQIKDEIEGGLEIFITNSSAMDLPTKRVVFNFLNSIRTIGPY